MADAPPPETTVEDETPAHEFFEAHLDALREPKSNTWATRRAIETSRRSREGKNRRCQRLSERPSDIVGWCQRGELNDPVAAETLARLERHALAVAANRSGRDLSEPAYAIFAELVHHQDGVDEAEAERLARDIVESFEARIDTSFGGWESNERTTIAIQNAIVDVLAKEHDRFDLAETRGFVERARQYLIEAAGRPSTTE